MNQLFKPSIFIIGDELLNHFTAKAPPQNYLLEMPRLLGGGE
jgi:hypothetical protein